MEINVELLISEIHKRPVLWNQKDKCYHNRVICEKNWQSLEKTMKQPKEQLKKKWKGLRDQFRNEFKKIRLAQPGDIGISEERYDKYVGWPYFKSLLFLKNQMKRRTSTGNMAAIIESTPKIVGDFIIEENLDDGSVSCDYTEETADIPRKIGLNLTDSNEHAERWAIQERKLESLEKKVNARNERGDDEAFLESLLPYFRNMDLNRKMLCRMEIQRTVYIHAFPSSEISSFDPQQLNGNNSQYSAPAPNVQCPEYAALNSPPSRDYEQKLFDNP